MAIDETIDFLPLNIAILTLSDTRTFDTDLSGQVLVDNLKRAGHNLCDRAIIKDDKDDLRNQLQKWIMDDDIQVIISTGGTGLTGRDITPEIFHEFYEKE
ncbi:MAG: molybdopterin-binding protein, partial [Emcibacteraceae bacterium]|nr:molybdopterin-binding protein [Emcibacteraceae bacterium]